MHRRSYFLHKGVNVCFVPWSKQGHDRTREPEELEANRQGVTPRLELQESDAGHKNSQAARYQNSPTRSSAKQPSKDENRKMERKERQEEQVQNRTDVEPCKHG